MELWLAIFIGVLLAKLTDRAIGAVVGVFFSRLLLKKMQGRLSQIDLDAYPEFPNLAEREARLHRATKGVKQSA